MTSTTQANPRLEAIAAAIERHGHGRVPRELRRRQLLELATELFAERGFAAASMDELAARAGVSKPVIYDQFGSKEGLLLAAIDALGEELSATVVEAVAGRTDPEDLMRAGSLAFFRFVGERSATWAMVFGATRSISDASPPAMDKLDEIRRRQDGLVSAVILASARELGGEPGQLELGAITRALNGVYEGLVDWWAEHPEVEAEQLTEWVRRPRPARARGDGRARLSGDRRSSRTEPLTQRRPNAAGAASRVLTPVAGETSSKERSMAATSHVKWTGDLKAGQGSIEVGSGALTANYSAASRFSDGEGTNPEELLAAAHAGLLLDGADAGPRQCRSRARERRDRRQGAPPQGGDGGFEIHRSSWRPSARSPASPPRTSGSTPKRRRGVPALEGAGRSRRSRSTPARDR